MGRSLRKIHFPGTKEETNCAPEWHGDLSTRIGRPPKVELRGVCGKFIRITKSIESLYFLYENGSFSFSVSTVIMKLQKRF